MEEFAEGADEVLIYKRRYLTGILNPRKRISTLDVKQEYFMKII